MKKEDAVSDLQEQNKKLRALLGQTLKAMCSYRADRGVCASCNMTHYCLAKEVIPKVEKALKVKGEQK